MPDVPPGAPLGIPEDAARNAAYLRRTALWRRLVYFALVIVSTLSASYLMADVLRANGFTAVEMAIFALFTISFAWISTSFWTATVGFVVRLFGRDPAGLDPSKPVELKARTAIIMPIYNEDPNRVFAGLEATWRSLKATGEDRHFDLFVLSDTRKPEIAAEEEAGWAALCKRMDGNGRIFYRRREDNTGRKAGNIAEFLRNWGASYDHMLVLDADSVMSGDTIVSLSKLMQDNPGTGIIQTLPAPVNQETLFGRILQFGSRLYGPALVSGLSWWQLGEGNYWGHNAIIRTSAFIEHCGLPVLSGQAPLGGEILSHDFVEAALMRRAGWQVWIVPELQGSFEELPPNTIDYAVRDRRWCQGNLQHLRLLPTRGLHPLSRLHLIMGVLGYVSSPLWLLLLTLSTIDILHQTVTGHSYFLPGYNLFPNWPVSKMSETISLFGVTIAILLLPKIYSLILTMANGPLRRGFGGGGKLWASAFLELLFSMLLAPAMMLFHTHFVVATLMGKSVTWNAQPRGERGLTLREAIGRNGLHVALGLAWGALVLNVAPDFFWWLVPVITGLVVSVWLTVWTSRTDFGLAARRAGLFLTPEEVDPPPELRRLATAEAEPTPAVDPSSLTRVPPTRPSAIIEQSLTNWSPTKPGPGIVSSWQS
ncbi:glucans biosynthesis glucosyltransferase MdoH [Skermanella stibiiresistens]|uniref:glucans biosynthesis glucosyltransferase MdoH n=1 Tax=Skermanella stibiiresistens TaxID=913326 RepID=UPI0004BB5D41|nr:glucans biosynthesis glucosyltransferase MdoH [Skermanella stibiiresistens]